MPLYSCPWWTTNVSHMIWGLQINFSAKRNSQMQSLKIMRINDILERITGNVWVPFQTSLSKLDFEQDILYHHPSGHTCGKNYMTTPSITLENKKGGEWYYLLVIEQRGRERKVVTLPSCVSSFPAMLPNCNLVKILFWGQCAWKWILAFCPCA